MEAVGGCRTISCPLARTSGPSVRSAMKHPEGVVECGGLLERISLWTTNCARRCPPDSHPISGDSRRGAQRIIREMGIALGREWVRVAKKPTDDFQAEATGNDMRSVGMSIVVKTVIYETPSSVTLRRPPSCPVLARPDHCRQKEVALHYLLVFASRQAERALPRIVACALYIAAS